MNEVVTVALSAVVAAIISTIIGSIAITSKRLRDDALADLELMEKLQHANEEVAGLLEQSVVLGAVVASARSRWPVFTLIDLGGYLLSGLFLAGIFRQIYSDGFDEILQVLTSSLMCLGLTSL